MRKAYDTILSDYVDANTAAKNGGFEPYRYECACCWEEVHVCAADSYNRSVHFRHRSGNNNVECENYLGNRNAVIHDAAFRRKIQDKVEFYFSNTTKMFSVGVKFSAEEIAAYEQSLSTFQVRNAFAEPSMISVLINSNRFVPDVTELIPLKEFSWAYYISSTNDSKQRKYEMFRKDGHNNMYPSFFKMLSTNVNSSIQAKLVRSNTLYTNTTYLMVFPHQFAAISFNKDMQVGKVIKFRTMSRDFSSVIITFVNKAEAIERQLATWNYRLETNETLTILWPPSTQVDDTILIKTTYAYIFASFEMRAHGNINVHSNDIIYLGDGVSKINVKGRVKVYKKNSELLLAKQENIMRKYDVITTKLEVAKQFLVQDNSTYVFNHSGVAIMTKGTSVSLTSTNEVRHYTFGYLDRIITMSQSALQDSKSILQDILMYYKREELFSRVDFDSLILSSAASQYIKSCERTGKINSAAKRFIKEGRI